MTIGPVSQCFACKHYRSPFDEEGREGPTCDAFPDGIPDVIIGMEFDHRQPFEGDHGIQWASDGAPYPEESLIQSR